MENLNNVPSTGTFGGSINQVNQNFGLVKDAIENVEGRTIRSKGLFPTQAALIAAYPSPKVGDYAYVGSSLPATIYDCEVEGTWHNTQQQGGSESVPLNNYPTKSEMNAAIAAIEIETVDNLNEETAASGKALDAHQGFVLAEQIGDVQEEMDELQRNGGDVWINHSVGSGITNYIKSSGAWGTGGNHFLVPVSVGEIYRLTTGANGTYYAWLSGTETSGTPSYTDGSTTSKKINGNTTSGDLVVPSGTNYMYILRNISSTSYIPTLQKKTFFGSLKEQVYKNKDDIEEIGVENLSFTEDTHNDLVLSDENGNDIVQFRNGHIYTKKFASDNVTLDGIVKYIRDLYQGKKCAIVGDSISTFSGYMPSGYETYYPQGEVSDVSECWWKIVCDVLGMTPVNCAWSGSKVTGAPKGATAAAGCSDQRIADCGRNGNPDIIIFYIGCNDWGNEVSLGTWNVNSAIIDDSEYTSSQTISDFRAAYALMLKKAKLAYPLAKIFCCTILDDVRRDSNEGYPSNNGNGVTTFTWNQSIKEVAEALGASVIDLHSCGLNFFNIVEHSVDVSKGQPAGLHPDIWGHSQMAIKVINSLIGS